MTLQGFAASVMAGGLALTLSTSGLAMEKGSQLAEIIERGVLKAGVRQDNPPHSFIDRSGSWVGFDVDMAHAIADSLDLALKMVPVDELTRISFLQNGTIDIAAASMSHTWKRDDVVDFSQTYFWSSQTFLVRQDRVSQLEDLVGKPVAMSRGSHSVGNWKAWLRRQAHPVDTGLIIEFGDKQSAVRAVLQGAVLGWAEDAEILVSYAREHPELTVLLNDAIGMKQDGIGVRENSSDLLDAINRALQEIERSGLYDEIYNEWFGPESATPIPMLRRIEIWPDG